MPVPRPGRAHAESAAAVRRSGRSECAAVESAGLPTEPGQQSDARTCAQSLRDVRAWLPHHQHTRIPVHIRRQLDTSSGRDLVAVPTDYAERWRARSGLGIRCQHAHALREDASGELQGAAHVSIHRRNSQRSHWQDPEADVAGSNAADGGNTSRRLRTAESTNRARPDHHRKGQPETERAAFERAQYVRIAGTFGT